MGVASSVLIQSCGRHALADYEPSRAMKQQWHTVSRSLMAGPLGWSDAFMHVAQPLLGFPSSVLPVEAYAQLAQLSAISRTEVDVQQVALQLRSGAHTHAHHEWLSTASVQVWDKTLQMAREHHLLRPAEVASHRQ
eukprot:316051-Amphidinium_carterae.1